ncbi:hypothetical protein Mth01_42360 [Sphaerimonospora thailandensis]|uniref:Uncharacterized protein n=1 Tax=Sphaerimonospora thailandensis TaxID=795644 RepID=A0A8J3RGL3_9ACTN|nr:hypothetical protein Mth01_42360 [Sphaerimonospora thailandensis]
MGGGPRWATPTSTDWAATRSLPRPPGKGLRPLGTAVLPEASTVSATVVDEDGV